jgi:hypothetical protein
MDLGDYSRIHRETPERWTRGFRGMGPFPLRDPLAWLAGNRERQRLAQASAGS